MTTFPTSNNGNTPAPTPPAAAPAAGATSQPAPAPAAAPAAPASAPAAAPAPTANEAANQDHEAAAKGGGAAAANTSGAANIAGSIFEIGAESPGDRLIEDIAGHVANFAGMTLDAAKEVTKVQLRKAEQLIAEHGNSKNFPELARNLAAQSANDAAQLGLSLGSDAQHTMRNIMVSAISALRVFLTTV